MASSLTIKYGLPHGEFTHNPNACHVVTDGGEVAYRGTYADCEAYLAERAGHADEWEVVVGNIGTVYSGPNEDEARKTFRNYRDKSIAGVGRGSGEDVSLFLDGELEAEHYGESAVAWRYEACADEDPTTGEETGDWRVIHGGPIALVSGYLMGADWAEHTAKGLAEAVEACRAVMDWARTPGEHGGNPYCKAFVKAASRALAHFDVANGRGED